MADNNPVYSLLPVQAALLRHLAQCLLEMEVDLDALLAREGYRADTWLDGKHEMPALILEKLLKHCLDETGDQLFGFHLAQRVKPEGFGVVGYIRQACQNLQDFILVCIRYEHLISGFGKTRLQKEPGGSVLTWSARTLNPTFERHATEFILTALHSTHSLRINQQSPWLNEVRFSHPAPDSLGARKEVEAHFGCRVRYNQSQSALVLDPDALTQPFSAADPALLDSLKRHAQSLETSVTEQTFYFRAYRMMKELIIAQRASKQTLADCLGISDRHLHRQLAREQINYRALYEQVLLTLAIEYLSDTTQTIEDIAISLGYTESQSFIRWFKKQTGLTPNRYRESALSRNL